MIDWLIEGGRRGVGPRVVAPGVILIDWLIEGGRRGVGPRVVAPGVILIDWLIDRLIEGRSSQNLNLRRFNASITQNYIVKLTSQDYKAILS